MSENTPLDSVPVEVIIFSSFFSSTDNVLGAGAIFLVQDIVLGPDPLFILLAGTLLLIWWLLAAVLVLGTEAADLDELLVSCRLSLLLLVMLSWFPTIGERILTAPELIDCG